ncbi:MAG: outer membrane beta-barrel protein [Bacteroidales bacterium]|nr:outer membrane beta-barrel protein [Bacteroidales bacterium]MBO7565677.1 outer membrane beta-barrel protein [Bacteroidales bacterium]MBP5683126.1 outer membrane beta-barrel protein [Bacteroidales bacterium]
MYRRLLLILSLLVVMTHEVMAQATVLGFSLGANFSNLVGPGKIEGSKPRFGFCPGLVLNFPTAFESYLEVGAFYSQQGVNIKTEDYGADPEALIPYMGKDLYYKYTQQNIRTLRYQTNISKHVNYLCIPVMWKQSFGALYGKIGPWASFALDAYSQKKVTIHCGADTVVKYDSSKDTTAVGKAFNQSFINKLRKYDVGGAISVGYQTAIGQGLDLFIDVSYKVGFFSVEDEPQNRKSTIRNMYFTVSTGLFFVRDRRSRTYRRR